MLAMFVISFLLPLLGLVQAFVPARDSTFSFHRLQPRRSIEDRGIAGDIWEQIYVPGTCAECQALLVSLKGIAELGDDAVVDAVQRGCKLVGFDDDDICDGSAALQAPIVAEAVRNMRIWSRTASEFCITFFGLCEYPDLREWDVPFPSEKPSGGRPAASGQDPIKVVHYSDIHIDPLYTPGSSAECSKPICCRPYTEKDEPGNAEHPAGPYGDHNCDVPFSLEESMYKAINELVPDAAFSIFTGDVVDHAVWNTTEPYNTEIIRNSYDKMNHHLGLVYGTVGNHEAHPNNAFQPRSVGMTTQWVYDLFSKIWSGWIDVAADTEQVGSYSTRYPDGNLRIVSLNTNLYYRQNYWQYQEDMVQDPSGQLAWLVKELDAAEKAEENVYIVAHMPFGDANTFHDQSNYLDQILNRYSSTIAAMFFGHTHRDHFQITYSNYSDRSYSNARITSYIAPSLTPTSGMPSFRVYDVDPVTFGVLDSTTYVADMTNPSFQTTGPVWTKYYSAKEAYGPHLDPPVTDPQAELSPAFWHNLTSLMLTDGAVFSAYVDRKSRGWKNESCTGTCKSNEICQLRAARSQDNCYTPKPGLKIRRKKEDQLEERDEDGDSVIGATSGALVM